MAFAEVTKPTVTFAAGGGGAPLGAAAGWTVTAVTHGGAAATHMDAHSISPPRPYGHVVDLLQEASETRDKAKMAKDELSKLERQLYDIADGSGAGGGGGAGSLHHASPAGAHASVDGGEWQREAQSQARALFEKVGQLEARFAEVLESFSTAESLRSLENHGQALRALADNLEQRVFSFEQNKLLATGWQPSQGEGVGGGAVGLSAPAAINQSDTDLLERQLTEREVENEALRNRVAALESQQLSAPPGAPEAAELQSALDQAHLGLQQHRELLGVAENQANSMRIQLAQAEGEKLSLREQVAAASQGTAQAVEAAQAAQEEAAALRAAQAAQAVALPPQLVAEFEELKDLHGSLESVHAQVKQRLEWADAERVRHATELDRVRQEFSAFRQQQELQQQQQKQLQEQQPSRPPQQPRQQLQSPLPVLPVTDMEPTKFATGSGAGRSAGGSRGGSWALSGTSSGGASGAASNWRSITPTAVQPMPAPIATEVVPGGGVVGALVGSTRMVPEAALGEPLGSSSRMVPEAAAASPTTMGGWPMAAAARGVPPSSLATATVSSTTPSSPGSYQRFALRGSARAPVAAGSSTNVAAAAPVGPAPVARLPASGTAATGGAMAPTAARPAKAPYQGGSTSMPMQAAVPAAGGGAASSPTMRVAPGVTAGRPSTAPFSSSSSSGGIRPVSAQAPRATSTGTAASPVSPVRF